MGGPGAGKGTASEFLQEKGYICHSTGDMMRQALFQNHPRVMPYAEDILHHRPIPPKIIQELIEQCLSDAKRVGKGVVLDGYPKEIEQCLFIDRFAKEHHVKTVCVLIDVLPDNAAARIRFREVCDRCKKIFNAQFVPPKVTGRCDDCDIPLSKRADDRVANVEERIRQFKSRMKPVLDYYGDRLHLLDGNAAPEICRANFERFYQMQLTEEKTHSSQ